MRQSFWLLVWIVLLAGCALRVFSQTVSGPVKPKSGGEAKGLKPGDNVLKIGGIAPNRGSIR
jgi:membrane-associated protease RseP (regulator of RpoE activity)